MSECGPDRYFDSAVDRCAGCQEICYAWTINDKTSDCNAYCPNYISSGIDDQTPPNQISLNEYLPYVGLSIVAVLVSAVLIAFFLLRRKRRRTSSDKNPNPETVAMQENTPIQEQAQEVGFSDLHIPHMEYPTDTLLTTTGV